MSIKTLQSSSLKTKQLENRGGRTKIQERSKTVRKNVKKWGKSGERERERERRKVTKQKRGREKRAREKRGRERK